MNKQETLKELQAALKAVRNLEAATRELNNYQMEHELHTAYQALLRLYELVELEKDN